MGEGWLLLLLGLLTGCAVVTTAALCVAARDLRRVLRRMEALAPRCDLALRDVHSAFDQAHRLLSRANRATREVEGIVQRTCTAASDVVEQIVVWKERAQALFAGHLGNGARAGPRRRNRQ